MEQYTKKMKLKIYSFFVLIIICDVQGGLLYQKDFLVKCKSMFGWQLLTNIEILLKKPSFSYLWVDSSDYVLRLRIYTL
jgi:hypothetical protein